MLITRPCAFAYRLKRTSLIALISFLASCVSNQTASTQPSRFEPEPAAKLEVSSQKSFLADNYLAVTANPHATQAAVNVLERGGSAVDAAIAAQMVLGLVEPQSSGLGGGGFLVFWDNKNKTLITYDGRETAPLAADEGLFLKQPATQTTPAQKMSFVNAVVGGRSVGTPGLVKMLEKAHGEYGHMDWSTLFGPAIDLAEKGFKVSPRLHQLIANVPAVNARPEIARYLFDSSGKPLATDTPLKNKKYAQTLKLIRDQGSDGFYQGKNARDLVERVQNDSNTGKLGLLDLNDYRAKNREAVCAEVFEHKVCGMALPSSGPTTVITILKLLEILVEGESAKTQPLSLNDLYSHYFIEATRLAFADRNTYLADPDFVDVSVEALIDSGYLRDRAQMVNDKSALLSVEPGNPPAIKQTHWLHAPSSELASTTHLSIVDAQGNIVSMTTSIELAFGSRLMTGGYILNNQLTDFSFLPQTPEGKAVANRVQAGKRPLSSMSPIIVFNNQGEVILAIGSPGGKSIISYVARTLFEILALGRPLEDAINNPHIIHNGRSLVLEEGTPAALINALEEKGHKPSIRAQASGIHAIQKVGDQWLGVADMRREGTAAGN